MTVAVMKELLSDQFVGKLETLAQTKAEEYKANTPYPHIYFDDFLPVDVAEAALRDFPEPKEAAWSAYKDVNQHKKLAFDAVEKLPDLQRDVLRLRFGFGGDSPASLQSTAERLGVGVRRVRRAEEEALAALSFDADVLGVHQAA